MRARPLFDPDFEVFLPGWLARQRWFAGKGREPMLSLVGSFRFEDPEGEVGVQVMFLRDDAGQTPMLYQVPLTYRGEPMPGGEDALVARTTHRHLGDRYIYDGCKDEVFTTLLLQAILSDGDLRPSRSDRVQVQGQRHPQAREVQIRSSRVLSGEQSNTSIIYEAVDADGNPAPMICKLFRVLHHGQNPDVVLQSALAAAGSDLVPAPVGHLEGSWLDIHVEGAQACGPLAFASEFLPGTTDAWRVALAAAADDVDFTERAFALGAATAQVHRDLAAVLPTQAAGDEERDTVRRSFSARMEAAVADAPELAESRAAIERVLHAGLAATWPALQRVHGDYHLGQVLDVPQRGWVLLDFEGEPMRPMNERSRPDLALRDVAGMLRSFDYVAGSIAKDEPQRAEQAQEWAQRARSAFLDGYASGSQDPRTDPDRAALLSALELDKALYEVSYEARNRPDWLAIPTQAVTRLCAAAPTEQTAAPTTPNTMPRSVTDVSTQPTPSSESAEPAVNATGEGLSTSRAGSEPLPVPLDELDLLVRGGHGDPHSILGAHPHEGGLTVRALRPLAHRVEIELADGSRHDLSHEHEGVWVIHLPQATLSDYRLFVAYEDGLEHRQDDPYRFWPTLGEIDLHLIGEGRHEELWKVLGSHLREYEGEMGPVHGASFAVWAPNARAIRLVGDFNRWDGQAHPMRALGSSGVWELFVPGVVKDTKYKYEILGADGYWRTKADPMARATECPPATASVVTQTQYEWQDQEWMTRRGSITEPHNEPMSAYEVHLGSWRQGLSYVELAEHLVNYVKDLGFTHVEFMPVAEHPYGPSWGYQVTGYYAPTSRFGSPDEFRYLVDRLHQAGIGVIVDWVPAHFPKDGFALGRFDGQPLYEHPDPRRGEHKDWGTYIFDFGRPQVRNFLVANACFWIEEFHIDGLRVDAVASMLYHDYSREDGEWYPNQFGGRENLEAVQLLQETNATLYRRYPGVITIAEESTSWGGVTKPTYMGGLGFGLKWNMGWMHDTLGYVQLAPIYRQYHHHQITFSMVYAYSENFCLPISHDEVVYGKGSMLRKMPGDRWEQLSGLRAYYAFMWSHPGKQLLFMGQEFAQESEWADSRSLDWWLLDQEPHWKMHALVKDLNQLYAKHPALWELDNDWEGFAWIDANDASGNTYSYLRFGKPDDKGERPVIACVVNYSGMEHHQYRIGLPRPGVWREVLNTDSENYGGAGVGNLGEVVAEDIPWHGQPYSALITMQKLSALWFEPADRTVGEDSAARAQTRGVPRPELTRAPIIEGEKVKSDFDPADLAEPRVGRLTPDAPATAVEQGDEALLPGADA
ncbi:1,4-alpha-glucan branching protein GlgB [Gephyromycinifex aptenodytis]|uniref:1,4-alpha-glucan branching protein GlgB n=1 Tax=Gephyromycinifex aptenodytis TaxID=2716227 RepID=UPI001447DD55|nr:1,4-alpha-glucan branching protein GlgB [Gephyromycinifex aptenodytis]